MPQAVAAVVIPIASAIGGAVTAVASIIPGVSALGAMTAGHVAGTFVASAAFTNGLAAGFSALALTASLASAISGPPRPAVGVANGGTQVDFKADPTAPLPLAFGRTGTGGNIVFTATANDDNEQLAYLTVLSACGPIQEIESFSADDITIEFSRTAPTGDLAVAGFNPDGTPNDRFSGGENFLMWDRRQLGDNPSPAFYPPAVDFTKFPTWTDAHKLSGLAAAWWVISYEPKTYSSGTPKPLWIVKGVKAYDPRLDSTYPGGAGPQRAGDRSTWAYTENPGLLGLAWTLGYYANGKKVMGVGAPIAGVDVPAFVEAANVADANGWKCGGIVYSSDGKWDVLRTILQACATKPMRLGASVSCFVSTPRVSIATLTGGDVVGEAVIPAGRARRERINAVAPRYRSEEHGWQLVEASPIIVSDYVAFDGRQRTKAIAYPLVQDVDQLAELAAYDIVDSREFGPVSFACKPRWGGMPVGAAVTVNEPEFGLNNQKMVIVGREHDLATGQVMLQLRTETDGKHDFALGRTTTPPPTPGITGVDTAVVPTPGVASWTCTGGVVAGPNGAGKVPAIIITGAVDNPLVQGVIVEYRERTAAGPPAVFADWIGGGEFPANTTNIVITSVKASTTYQVRLRYRTVRGVDDVEAALVFALVTTGKVDAGTINGVDPTPFIPGSGDGVAPAAPTAVSAEAAFETIFLRWTSPTDADLAYIEIWENTINVVPNPVTQASLLIGQGIGQPGKRGFFSRDGLAHNTTRYYWLRAVDVSGNASPFSAGVSATTARIGFDAFADQYQPIQRGTVLPSPTGYTGPDLFTLLSGTAPNITPTLYRYKNGAWVKAIDATDLTGQLTDAQIQAIAATKIAGQLTDAQIASIDAAKISSQIVAGQITAGAVTAGKIAALAVTATELAAGAVVAGKIAAGAILAGDIAAGQITTTKLAAGAVTANELAANSVTANKIQTGVIVASHIASDTITGNKIAANSITTLHLVANAITADKITAGVIDAGKIAINGVELNNLAAGISKGSSASSDGGATVAPGGTATLVSTVVSPVTSDGVTIITGSGYVNPVTWPTGGDTTSQYDTVNFLIYRDFTLLRSVRAGVAVNIGTNFLLPGGQVGFSVRDTGASAGAHLYALVAEVTGPVPVSCGFESFDIVATKIEK